MTYAKFIKDKLKDQEVHVIGSGPSLKDFDYTYFDDKNVIAINHTYKLLNNPLWCVSVDRAFVEKEDNEAPNKVTLLCRKMIKHPGVVAFDHHDEFDMLPENGVYHRKSSGVSAITTALHAGAEKIYIHGLDCCFVNGISHSTEGIFGHRKTDLSYEKTFKNTVELFGVFRKEKIINMSQISIIPYFERGQC